MINYSINYKISSPIILIILFIAGYLMWNNFELPTIFTGKTEKIIGKVFEIKVGYGIRGIGYIQNVNFIYEKNGKYFEGRKKVDKKFGVQTIGNRVSLNISSKKFDKYKVLGFFSDFTRKNFSKRVFLKSENAKYTEIELINGIFISEKVKKGGIESIKRFGLYYEKNDTITVDIFKEIKYSKEPNILSKNCLNLKFILNKNGNNELLDIKNCDIYKQLSDRIINKNLTKGTEKLTRE